MGKLVAPQTMKTPSSETVYVILWKFCTDNAAHTAYVADGNPIRHDIQSLQMSRKCIMFVHNGCAVNVPAWIVTNVYVDGHVNNYAVFLYTREM